MHLTLDAITLILKRHEFVPNGGIGVGKKALKLLHERFECVETPTVVTLVEQLARLQLRKSEDLDSLFIRGQELFTRLQGAEEAVSETLFNKLFRNSLPMIYDVFVLQEKLQLCNELRTVEWKAVEIS